MPTPSLNQIIRTITYSKLLVTFESVTDVELPVYKGATFRGCMGEAFRRQVCKYRGLACEECRLQGDCLFAFMYSKPLEKDHPAFGKFTLPPRPYILNPMPGNETQFAAGSRFGFELILIGDATQQLTAILPAVFSQMGNSGIGKGRGKFHTVNLQYTGNTGEPEPILAIGLPYIHALDGAYTEESFTEISLQFENPIRLLSARKPMKEPPGFDRLISNLAARMALLANVYCHAPWLDTETLNLKSEVTMASHNLEWVDWKHFSGPKKQHMNFDGYIGKITYNGILTPWYNLLLAGEILHAGSTATFGLGKYRVELMV